MESNPFPIRSWSNMQNEIAVKQRGFWFKAFAGISKWKKEPMWNIEIFDNPSDPDWAAWCTLIELREVELSDGNVQVMETGKTLHFSGVVI